MAGVLPLVRSTSGLAFLGDASPSRRCSSALLRSVKPTVTSKKGWTSAQCVLLHAVRLEQEVESGHRVLLLPLGLPHLHAALCRRLVRIEVVRSPVVGEAKVLVQLRRVET